jgi:hypothetical protein
VASGADRVEDVLDESATQRMVAHLDAMSPATPVSRWPTCSAGGRFATSTGAS